MAALQPASPLYHLQQHFDYKLSLLQEQPQPSGLADLLTPPLERCQSAPLDHVAPSHALPPASASLHLNAHQQQQQGLRQQGLLSLELEGEQASVLPGSVLPGSVLPTCILENEPELPSPSLLILPPGQRDHLLAQQAQQAAVLEAQRLQQAQWCVAAERLLRQSSVQNSGAVGGGEGEGGVPSLGAIISSLQREIEGIEHEQQRQEQRAQLQRGMELLQAQQAQQQQQLQLQRRGEWEAAQLQEAAEWEARRAREAAEWEERRRREQAEWEAKRRREAAEWKARQQLALKQYQMELMAHQQQQGQGLGHAVMHAGADGLASPEDYLSRKSAPGCLQRGKPSQGTGQASPQPQNLGHESDWWKPSGHPQLLPTSPPVQQQLPHAYNNNSNSRHLGSPVGFRFERSLTSTSRSQANQRSTHKHKHPQHQHPQHPTAAAAAAGGVFGVAASEPLPQQGQWRGAGEDRERAAANGPPRKRRSVEVPEVYEVIPIHRSPSQQLQLQQSEWDLQTQRWLAQQAAQQG